MDLNNKLEEIEKLLKEYNEEAEKIGEGKAVSAKQFVLVVKKEHEKMLELWESSERCW